MSEFTSHKQVRIKILKTLFGAILKNEKVKELYEKNLEIINLCIPSDVINLVDELVILEIPMPELKNGINKLLNLLYRNILEYPYMPPVKNSYLWVLQENNRIMLQKLNELKPFIKRINQNIETYEAKQKATDRITELEKFTKYYLIKENVLFPVIEKYLPEFRCTSVMWSFHDDIKLNLKKAIEQLSGNTFNLKEFNRSTGDLYFNMNAIKFREERILYPAIADIIPKKELDALLPESLEIGFPFYQPEIKFRENKLNKGDEGTVDLETGNLSVEQIKLLFNHLPVDITYVNEFDKVQYFSTPKKRIFPRTKSIIGRDVHNCHPKESVHVVEKIVQAFREGKKDVASFWIDIKGEKLLIQYFAVRDEAGNYKGVVEVSQEITGIQNLKRENRLLDWDD
ncbi:MAG: PAS domain-containing protein [Bacteroidota bacterium]